METLRQQKEMLEAQLSALGLQEKTSNPETHTAREKKREKRYLRSQKLSQFYKTTTGEYGQHIANQSDKYDPESMMSTYIDRRYKTRQKFRGSTTARYKTTGGDYGCTMVKWHRPKVADPEQVQPQPRITSEDIGSTLVAWHKKPKTRAPIAFDPESINSQYARNRFKTHQMLEMTEKDNLGVWENLPYGSSTSVPFSPGRVHNHTMTASGKYGERLAKQKSALRGVF
jgi:hypothetical protein